MNNKKFNNEFNEYMFYLSIILLNKYLKNKHILINIYNSKIYEIYQDYIKYNNNNKSLVESIKDYIEIREDFILNLLNECVEV